MSPPSARASRRERARPTPVPVVTSTVSRFELVEVLKELAHRVRGDADARVAHGDANLVRRSLRAVSGRPRLRSVNLSAFESRLRRICRTRCASVRQLDRRLAGTSATELHVVARAQAVDLGDARARELRRCSRGARRTSRRPASAFARSSTSLMSDEQVLAVALDALERLARARADSCSLGEVDQEVGEAEDGAERRAQLVAHRREELRLHLVRARQATRPARASITLFSRRRSCVQALCRPTASCRARVAHDVLARGREAAWCRRRAARPRPRRRPRWAGRGPTQRRPSPTPRSRVGGGPPKSLVEQESGSRRSSTVRGRPSAPKRLVVDRSSRRSRWRGPGRGGRRRRAGRRRRPARRQAHEPAEPRRRQRA